MGSVINLFRKKNIITTITDIARKFNNSTNLLSKILVIIEGIMTIFSD